MRRVMSMVALSACLAFGTNLSASEGASSTKEVKQQSGNVINLAGKQRMLTQKMSKEALFVAKGVDVDNNKANLDKTVALFDKTLHGLIAGDSDLGLPKTENADILAQLTVVKELWTPFKASIQKGDLKAISEQNIPLLKNMNKAVQMYAKASGSKLDPAMAQTINLAGRQRMLTQKMTKELLLVANGIDAQANQENAKKTFNLFKTTLADLIAKAPNDAIKAQLNVVKGLMEEYQPIIENVDTSAEALKKAEGLNMKLLKESNKAVQLYTASIK
jgi:hypothetical protein